MSSIYNNRIYVKGKEKNLYTLQNPEALDGGWKPRS